MKKQSMLFILLFFALLLVTFLPDIAAAQSPIPAGQWTGHFEREWTWHDSTNPDVIVNAISYESGSFDLDVSNDGTVTGLITDIHFIFAEHVMGLVPFDQTCDFRADAVVTGGKVSENAAHLPVFNLQVVPTISTIECNPPLDFGGRSPETSSLHMEGLTFTGGKIKGAGIRFTWSFFSDYKIDQTIQDLIELGVEIDRQEYWELNFKGADVTLIKPKYEEYFLKGIPFKNKYTAQVDWYDNPEGEVLFQLEDQPDDQGQTEKSSGGQAVAEFELDTLKEAGIHLLRVTAITAEGLHSGTLSHDVVIVPLEVWAQKANFIAPVQGDPLYDEQEWPFIIYHGKTQVPEEPLMLPLLDTGIPLIGKWGAEKFQIQVNLKAKSAGDSSQGAPVTGQTGFFWGGDEPEAILDARGQVTTTMTATASLKFDGGKVNFNMPNTKIKHEIPVLTLVPGASLLTNFPVVGELFTLLSKVEIAVIEVSMDVEANGNADLGLDAENSRIVFTQGIVEPVVKMEVTLKGGVSEVASIGVGGGGMGKFTIEIAPKPGLKNCVISFVLHAKGTAFGSEYQPINASYFLTECQAIAYNGQKDLVASIPPVMSQPSEPGSQASSKLLPRSASGRQLGARDGFELLAEDVAPHTEFTLAQGPDDRLAFIYTGQVTAPGDIDNENPGSEIIVRFFDGNGWGQTLNLNDDGLRAFSPVAAFDGRGNLVVVWVQSGQAQASEEDVLSEDFARTFEIVYKAIDPTSGEVITDGVVTEDDVMDFGPQLASTQDGSLWLAWMRSPRTNLWGSNGEPNHLLATHWDGSAWSPAQVVSDQMVGTLGFQLAAFNAGRALVVADQDGDGDPETVDDREVIAFEAIDDSWHSENLSQNDVLDIYPLAGYTPEGEPVVVWQQDSTPVLLEDDLSAEAEPLILDMTPLPNLSGSSLVVGQGGELALLWSDFTFDGGKIWLAQRSDSTTSWTNPQIILDGLAGPSSLTAQLTPQGDVWLGLAETHAASEQITLADGQVVEVSGLPESANLGVLPLSELMQPLSSAQSQSTSSEEENESGGIPQPRSLIIILTLCAAGFILLAAASIVVAVLKRGQGHPQGN